MSNAGSKRPDPSRNQRAESAAARYGDAHPSKPARKSGDLTGKALAAVVVAVIVALIYFSFQYFTERQKVNAEISMVSHEVIDDSTLRVWSDVTRSRPDEPAYCIVQAFDYSKAEVGRREFVVGPDGQEAVRVAVDVPTNARAVAGGVYGCSSEIPEYLDQDFREYETP